MISPRAVEFALLAAVVTLGLSVAQSAPGQSIASQATVELREIARIGSLDGPDQYRFGRVSSVAVDPVSSEVYVGDGLEYRVSVYSTGGEFRRSWGHEGEGPGEFRGSPIVAVARDTVMVVDGLRAHAFDRTGDLHGSLLPQARLRVTSATGVWGVPSGWVLLMREVEPGVTGSTPFERYYELSFPEGISGEWLHQTHHPGPGPHGVFSHKARSAVHGIGFVSAPAPDYRLLLHRPADAPTVIELAVERREVPEGALDSYATGLREQCEAGTQSRLCLARLSEHLEEIAPVDVPELRPVVGDLVGSQVGLILVQRSDLDDTPFRAGGDVHWDLIRDDGTYVGGVRFPDRFRPLWLGEMEVWGVELDSLDVPYVVGFSLSVEGGA